MTYSPDDLTPLLAGRSDTGTQFRQGVILEWDSDTGENTIQVAGSILVNVPILNTGEAVALSAGHVVGLLRSGSQYFILGRVTTPGAPDFASATVAFARDYTLNLDFDITTSFVSQASVELPVPAWADEALVLAVSTASGVNDNSAQQQDYILIKAVIDSDESSIMYGTAQYLEVGAATSSYNRVYTPGSTITVETLVATSEGTWGLHSGGDGEPPRYLFSADVTAFAIFRNSSS